MIYLKNISKGREAIVKDSAIAIARRFLESKEYNKEFIMDVTGITGYGYEEAIRREAIMFCAKKFCGHFTIEYLEREMELNEDELRDLIRFKERKAEEIEKE